MTGPWLTKPTLRGDLVVLRPPRRGDAVTIAELLADPELLRLTGSVSTSAEAAAFSPEPDEEILDWYATRADQADRLDLVVVEDGRVVGEVVLNEWNPATHSANFRILLATAARGRGIGTEATRLIVGHGFEHVGLHRIELGVHADNPRAVRAYEKVGFVREGVRRDAVLFDGAWGDELVMAILAPEWQQHRGRPTLPPVPRQPS